MSQEERFNTRDRTYSAWHRRFSTGRFIGIERAQNLAMIDLDASLYVEYDDHTKEPLALIETAVDVGQTYKTATVTMKLAKKAGIPAFVLLYRISTSLNPADPLFHDVDSFRVKMLFPVYMNAWKELSPAEWASALVHIRSDQCSLLDIRLFPVEKKEVFVTRSNSKEQS